MRQHLFNKAPSLEWIIVPYQAIDRYLNIVDWSLDSWSIQREELKNAPAFKEGKVKLRIAKNDETGEFLKAKDLLAINY